MDFSNLMNPAQESVFDPELTTQKLLENARTTIDEKITTVDAAAELENQLSEEAAEFNGMITMMNNAIHQCEAGEISREEMLAAVKPCVEALKTKCKALNLAGQSVDGEDITENELAMLREFIVGCKDIVATKKEELQDCPITQNAQEGLLSQLENMEVAQEAIFSPTIANQIRKGNTAKTATELYKNAKKLYGMGSKQKAIEYMQKAKKLYEKCLADAKKAGGERKIERATSNKGSYIQVTDTDKNYKVYKNTSYYQLVAYFEDRVDTCEAYLRQWQNKAGKSDLKTTREQLKAERKEEKARIKAEKKAAQEAFLENVELIDALESMMDGFEMDLALEAAMEAEGEEGTGSKAQVLGAKIRAAFGKLKKAKTEEEAAAAKKEVAAATNELKQAEAAAETPEEKKKLSTAAKIGIGAAGAALVAAGVVAGGQLAQKAVTKNGGSVEDAGKFLQSYIQFSNKVVAVPNKAYVAGSAKLGEVKRNLSDARDYHIARGAERREQAQAKQAQRVQDAQAGAMRHELRQKDRQNTREQNALNRVEKKSEKAEGKRIKKDQQAKWKAFQAEADEGWTEEDEVMFDLATESAIATMLVEDGLDPDED